MIRTAIIGLGETAETVYLPACAALPEIRVVGAADLRPERLIRIREQFKISALYEDAQTMLDREQPDFVIIAAPPDTHKQLCVQSLRHGADVLCETPFALTMEEADEVLAEAKKANRMVRVNTQYRFMNTYRTAHLAVSTRSYGKLFFVQCWQQLFDPPRQQADAWRSQLKQSTLFEFGSHPIDLICFFMGSLPEAVTCHTPRVRSEHDADVLVQMTLSFSEQRIATLVLNRASHAPERCLEMRLDCENASLRASLGSVARARVELGQFMGRKVPTAQLTMVNGGEVRVERAGTSKLLAHERFPAIVKATAAHLQQIMADRTLSHRPQEAGEYAREILRIILAGYRSAQLGQTVELRRSPQAMMAGHKATLRE